MNERLLQFIWQLQYYNTKELTAVSGEAVKVIYAGLHNTNQGPDFIEAKIKIGQTIWVGNVELHLKTSDWKQHGHHADPHYNNVILHVVWHHDETTNAAIPVLELQSRVSKLLLQQYSEWMNNRNKIPCEKNILQVTELTWTGWKDRLVAERLQRKIQVLKDFLQENNQHWEETFWWMIARNFGIKVNSEAFEKIARSLPVTILARHKNQIHQLEALLFGQSGLLDAEFAEEYPKLLKREYGFLQKKYKLTKATLQPLFLRMRPMNFPTVRLAQLAMLIHHSSHLFSQVKETVSLKEVKKLLDVTANDYWHYHYRFDEASSYKEKKLGQSMIDNIIINTIVPVLFAYGMFHKEQAVKNKALRWLEETTAEKNSILNYWAQLGISNKNAADSQALIELRTIYCNKKRCLDCAIGNSLLKKPETN
jgi:hypothetical protein